MIYPNFYIVLVGPSGRARKGIALGIAKSLITEVPGVSVSPEAASREAIIGAMKRAITNFQDPSDSTIRLHCSLTAFSEELSVFLGQNDIKFLATLTDWYDAKDKWDYETIGRGKDGLQGVCFNLLGATAPDWLQSMLPQEAVGGGFTSRVIFVVEERKGKTVPKHQLTTDEVSLRKALLRDLERISQLAGSFSFTPQGERAYTDWYSEQDKLLARGEAAVEDPRFSGYCERRATHLRKLMMIMSASRSDDLVIDEPDFKRAVQVLRATELKMHRTFGGLGSSRYSDVTEKIMSFIQSVGITTRSSLLTKFYRDVDGATLRVVEEVLDSMKVVEIKLIPDSRDKSYRWIGPKDK
ncbi:MAG: hypothetical protein ACYDB1_00750 [Acidiferrobacteraceae bacterium]